MPVLTVANDSQSPNFKENESAAREQVAHLESALKEAIEGGGERYRKRHHERGKLMIRERIELLIDRDSAYLELGGVVAYGTGFETGGGYVCGIGVVEGIECIVAGNDPTVRGGSFNEFTLGKSLRTQDLAMENRLPLINLVESGGADLPNQHKIFVPGGKWFRNLTRLSKAGVPTISLVFGNSTAGGAYVPGMSDYAVMVQDRAKVFLAGPPLVKMATGEESTDEELGGAVMHSRVSGLSDYLAVDEYDCLRIGRRIVKHLDYRKFGPGPIQDSRDPLYDPNDILGLIPANVKQPMDMYAILAHTVDGSEFDEYKAEYGTSLICGWATIHGYRVGIVANQRGVIFSDEAKKATEFISLCNQYDQPLVFIHNVTGYMVGKDYEQGGIIKDGAKMINVIANSTVPHIGIIAGASYGAGNYGMSGQAYNPRFLFSWPSAKIAVMGGEQLAGVMSIVGRNAAAASGREYDEVKDAAARAAIEQQIETEQDAFFMSARNRDDGVIDPRDTRTVLGIALSAIHMNTVKGTSEFGVFRM